MTTKKCDLPFNCIPYAIANSCTITVQYQKRGHNADVLGAKNANQFTLSTSAAKLK